MSQHLSRKGQGSDFYRDGCTRHIPTSATIAITLASQHWLWERNSLLEGSLEHAPASCRSSCLQYRQKRPQSSSAMASMLCEGLPAPGPLPTSFCVRGMAAQSTMLATVTRCRAATSLQCACKGICVSAALGAQGLGLSTTACQSAEWCSGLPRLPSHTCMWR